MAGVEWNSAHRLSVLSSKAYSVWHCGAWRQSGNWLEAGVCNGCFVVAYILFSLLPEEVIFWMRSWPRSVLSSDRVLVSSSLLLFQSSPLLTLEVDYSRGRSVSEQFVPGCRDGMARAGEHAGRGPTYHDWRLGGRRGKWAIGGLLGCRGRLS